MRRVTGEISKLLVVDHEDVEVYGSVSAGASVAEGRILTVMGNLSGHVEIHPHAVVSVQGNVLASLDVASTGLFLAAGNVSISDRVGPGAVGLVVGSLYEGRVLTSEGRFRDVVDGESLNLAVSQDAYRYLQDDGSVLSMAELEARSDRRRLPEA